MKVIIIKDCPKGKINDIIEVADGYAKNFLIKKGFALPMNSTTERKLKENLISIENNNKAKKELSLKRKKELEAIELSFTLKTTKDVIHGSITNKQILKQIKAKGFDYVTKYNLGHNSITSIGTTKIKIELQKDIIAIVKVKVEKNG